MSARLKKQSIFELFRAYQISDLAILRCEAQLLKIFGSVAEDYEIVSKNNKEMFEHFLGRANRFAMLWARYSSFVMRLSSWTCPDTSRVTYSSKKAFLRSRGRRLIGVCVQCGRFHLLQLVVNETNCYLKVERALRRRRNKNSQAFHIMWIYHVDFKVALRLYRYSIYVKT